MLSLGNTNSDDHTESDTELEKAEFPKPSMCKPLVIIPKYFMMCEFPMPYRFQTQDDRAPTAGRPWWKKDKNH